VRACDTTHGTLSFVGTLGAPPGEGTHPRGGLVVATGVARYILSTTSCSVRRNNSTKCASSNSFCSPKVGPYSPTRAITRPITEAKMDRDFSFTSWKTFGYLPQGYLIAEIVVCAGMGLVGIASRSRLLQTPGASTPERTLGFGIRLFGGIACKMVPTSDSSSPG